MTATSLASRRVAPAQPAEDSQPWWRYAMVWMVIAGPLAVVLASFVTLGIAWMNIDPLVSDSAPGTVQQRVPSGSSAPAQLARNHAATPQK